MKKLLIMLGICFILINEMVSYANENIKVVLDGEELSFDISPEIVNGRTMVPMRKIFEELGADVVWSETEKTAYGTKEIIEVKFALNGNEYYVCGIPTTLEVSSYIKNERMMIPLRAVAESFGSDVDWDAETQTVYIESAEMKLKENNEGTYYGEMNNELYNGFGIFKTNAGDLYIGEFVDGYKWGNGSYLWSNGNYYVGEFEDGIITGKGWYYADNVVIAGVFYDSKIDEGLRKEKYPSGDSCEMTIREGKIIGKKFFGIDGSLKNGYGRVDYSEQEFYIGDFIEGIMEGEGEYHWKSGNYYIGKFQNNTMNGQGEMCYIDGNTFVGDFVDGKVQNGYGKVKYEDHYYIGFIKDGKKTGKGKEYSNDGSNCYEGEWLLGERHGKGVLMYNDGSQSQVEYANGELLNADGKVQLDEEEWYVGQIINGKREGDGENYWANGNWQKGQFENNKFIEGTQKIMCTNGEYYVETVSEGETKDATYYCADETVKNGQERFDYDENSYYVGFFENGKIGFGERYWTNGDYYKGKFIGNQPWSSGNGIQHYSDGYYEGDFYDGYRWGYGTYTWTKYPWSGDYYAGGWFMGDRNGGGSYYDASSNELFAVFYNHDKEITREWVK